MSDRARVLFFATLRDKTGVREITIEFPQGSSISDIKMMMLEKYPGIKLIMESMIVALNHEFAFDEDVVPNEAEIAMFPPVSGGESNGERFPTIIAIVDHEIDINKIGAEITLSTTGAICIFSGIVREVTNRGVRRQTEHLEYEAYCGMAESKLRQISMEIRSQWQDVEGIALVQRIGKLLPGTVSVIVACSSSHRDSGIFEAARYGIDRLKEIVPVWKKEVGKAGEEWIEGEHYPQRGE
jgi:molybdopterin synthase catalytic subunit